MSDNVRYVAKWLDPRVHPIPANTPVIGYIKQQESHEDSPFWTAVYPIYLNEGIYTFMLAHDNNPSWQWKLYKEDIIAWMPLPNAPEEVSCPEIPDNS